MSINKTYWNGNGKYQEWYNQLKRQIPDYGESNKLHVEMVRNISNVYYDHFNNGDYNWDNKSGQFENIEKNSSLINQTAIEEGIDISSLLQSIKETLNNSKQGKDSDDLEYNLKKLTDIIVKWSFSQEGNK